MNLKKEFKGIVEYDSYNALCKLVEKANEVGIAALNKEIVYEKLKEYREVQAYVKDNYHVNEKACDTLVYIAILKAHEDHDKKINNLENDLKNNIIQQGN